MIARRTLLPMINLGVGAILGLIALKLIALYLGPVVLGEVAYAMAVLGVLYAVLDLGMGEAHVKRVSEGYAVGDCFATFAVFRTVSTLVFILVALGGIFVYGFVLDKPFNDTTLAALAFMLVHYVAKSIQNVAQSTFEARLEAARSQIVPFVETILRVGLTIVVTLAFAAIIHDGGPWAGLIDTSNPLWRWVADNPAGALAATYAVSAIVGTGVAWYYLKRVMERGRFQWPVLHSYFRFGLPLWSLTALGMLALFIDRIVLGFFGVAADTGTFEAPRRLVGVLEGLGAAVGILLFPSISQLLTSGDREGAMRMVDRSVRYLSMLTTPIAAFLVVFPTPIIRLTLDNEWVGNGGVLMLLAVYILLMIVSRPLMILLMGSDRPGVAARIGIVGGIIHIGLNLILVPDDIRVLGIDLFGLKALGAALATVIAAAVYVVLLGYATYRLSGYRPPVGVIKHVVAAGVMSLALLALDHGTAFDLGRWYTFLVYIPLGAIVYALALVALRELTREDVDYVKEVVHPGEMWRYLKSELFHRG